MRPSASLRLWVGGFLAAVGSLAAAGAAAGDLRIGLVDMARLFSEYPGMKAAQIRYDSIARAKEKLLTDEEQEIQSKRAAYEKKRAKMTRTQRETAEKELKERILAFEEKKAGYLEEMKQKEDEMSKGVVQEIRVIVERVAKKRKLDLVLDREKALYVRDSVDLTPEVLEQFRAAEKKAEP